MDAVRSLPQTGQSLSVDAGCPCWIRRASWLWLAGTTGLNVLKSRLDDAYWLSGMFLYLPRIVWLVPGILLLVAAYRYGQRWRVINVLSIGLVAWPLMGWEAPWKSPPGPLDGGQGITLFNCNVQSFSPDFSLVLAELANRDPDVICLQEAKHRASMLQQLLSSAGWHYVWFHEFVVASRFPVRLVDVCNADAFDRSTAVRVEVQSPEGAFDVVNVHLTSARFALASLSISDVLSGRFQKFHSNHGRLRTQEAAETSAFIVRSRTGRPELIVGDFNMPTDCLTYRRLFGKYQDAFEVCGSGYGFTAPLASFGFWPSNTPWIRIDLITGSSEWQFSETGVGTAAGSDHRSTWARAWLPIRDDREETSNPGTGK